MTGTVYDEAGSRPLRPDGDQAGTDAIEAGTRPARGVAMAALTTALYLPVHLVALLTFVFSAGRYDSSGVGGPFASCLPSSTACSGPNPAMMIVCGLVVSSGLLLAGLFGQRAGRFACPWCARLSLAALSAVLVAVAVALWW